MLPRRCGLAALFLSTAAALSREDAVHRSVHNDHEDGGSPLIVDDELANHHHSSQVQLLADGTIARWVHSSLLRREDPFNMSAGNLTGNLTSTNETAAEEVGVKKNSATDTWALVSSLTTNLGVTCFMLLFFAVAWRRVPHVYMCNALPPEDCGRNTAPFVPSSGVFGWIRASLGCTPGQLEQACGLDEAMLIEFTNLSQKLLLALGIPMMVVLFPLHICCGNGDASKQKDYLSMLGMANVEHGSWIYWVHAAFLWYVIIVVELMVYRAQQNFLPRRFNWLRTVPPPRCTTIMVEGIPTRHRGDHALFRYFSQLFPAADIERTYVAKHTRELQKKEALLVKARLEFEREERRLEKAEAAHDEAAIQRLQQEEEETQAKIDELERDVEDCRSAIVAKAQEIDSLLTRTEGQELGANELMKLEDNPCGQAGFVTFTSRREAMLMKSMHCSEDWEEFVVSLPPDPADVVYDDLACQRLSLRSWLGFSLIVLLYFVSLPTVAAIQYYTDVKVMKEKFVFVNELIKAWPQLEHILHGLLASLGITLWASMLPTVLMLIFSACFPLKANAFAQLKLHDHYFKFQVVFTILVTAIGNSLLTRVEELVENPTSIFLLLADAMPTATHFYMNFITMQLVPIAMDLTRYITLAKFMFFQRNYPKAVAIDLSEPEDQDYFGMGGRSARFSIQLCIAIIFSVLAPLILFLTLINFGLRRLVYGYLCPFAETRKHDLGGAFWVLKLRQLQQCVLIFYVLMMGVLARRAENIGVVYVGLPSIFFWMYWYSRFHWGLHWEDLPFLWVCNEKQMEGSNAHPEPSRLTYMQDELRDPMALPARHSLLSARALARRSRGHSNAGSPTGQETPFLGK